jgi:hypothetical protein
MTTMANWVGVSGNAIVQDVSHSCNIAYTNDGADVTPVHPTPSLGVFNCPLPSCPNGSLNPTSVYIGTESKFTTIQEVTVWCGVNELDTVSTVGGGVLTKLSPGTPPGSKYQGYNLRVTLRFGGPGAKCTITSLGLEFGPWELRTEFVFLCYSIDNQLLS